ncbi:MULTISPECIES: CBS domain-containing protein [Thalassospira]|jgi:CBS domain-containing protein|uniref:Histidine kinase n=1 Tax=Thalassospira xiamenensis TaxID=220697 RepID=A0ABR5Y2U3_9PROT|nr:MULTISPECIES: CBS domain-containing protein [Thalassospira]MBL4841004.1 CBS domain-containing protein [Thalassospira sp.]MBR9781877.1 CBS domain-containing protein [Rhodospirillales bacterium]KZD04787.1 histidine kinase [Thalassospira xiamenensis]KZD05563.1 histidine kinase [Thalassospira xiamenensis]MBR9816829.1 CBS domain-containing protein [Rhodospirillales bacterium]|tara:strand:+ start:14117 stop:14566 length:450 start_codon:yes stop_codon:yes gene_type:complete
MDTKIVPGVVKEQSIATLNPADSVMDAVNMMTERKIGAVIIVDNNARLAGIFTERDLVNRVVAKGLDAASTPLKQVMTTNPDTLAPGDTAMNALELMSARRYRHLPVLDGENVVGMVSIRDLFNVVKAQLEEDLREREKFIFGSDYGVA